MSDKIRIQDDLYQAVNGEWLEKAVIPDDKPFTGGFADLDEDVEKLLMADFKAFAKGEKTTDVPAMADAIKCYQLGMDEARRNEEGAKPVLPLLEKILSMKNIADLNKISAELYLSGAFLPFQSAVETDMADATKHCFIVLGPRIILPDTTYYDPSHPAGKMLLGIFAQSCEAALAHLPLSENERKKFVEDALAFDALVAKSVKSQLEWAEYVKNHNPMPKAEVAKKLGTFDFDGFLHALLGEKLPDTVVVYDPRAIEEFTQYFNEETFPLFVHWCYVRTFMKATAYLSLELRSIGATYRRALMGVAKDPDLDKDVYRMVSMAYAEPVGVYYGRTYFGEEAKKDVVRLVKEIIEMYKSRMKVNTFLSPETKEKAILKLSTIEIKMGYPDFVHDIFQSFVVEEGDSYYSMICKIGRLEALDNLSELWKDVDRTRWGMPGHMVNACYNPSMNDITFPAAILQKPFYSLQQSESENLGGIGAVIAHEVSHAFDNNGASFDEKGNLAQWWKPDDFAAFQKLTERMIEQFDGIPFHGGVVSGKLVVSENIADNGGMACSLAIMHQIKNPDFQAYFKNWARVWCQKAKEQYIQMLLQNDVHSPAVLRANMMPRNFSEWYEAFDVKETDQMYIPPEKRIVIW